MPSLDISDLIKHTNLWVLGQCVTWNLHAKQFADMAGREFHDFVNRTHTVVFRYLRGTQTLDGTCSDFECTIAIEARRVFGLYPIES